MPISGDPDEKAAVFQDADDHLLVDHDGSAAEHGHLTYHWFVGDQTTDSFEEDDLVGSHDLPPVQACFGGPYESRSKMSTLSVISPSSTVKNSAAGAVEVVAVCG